MPARCIVVGAGGISNAWFPHLVSEGVDIAAVVDLRLDAARAQAAKYALSCAVSGDLSATLANHAPDFVVDLTVPEAHCEVTCAALEAGCHVIGEKPMAASMDEARRMVAVAEATGRHYMVSQSRRWDRTHDRIRRTLASGEIGQITTVCCDFYLGAHFGGFRDEMPSPLILDMAIHHFDLCRFFTGLDPVAVYAHEFNPHGSWYRGDASATAIFELSEGVVFCYRGSWCSEGCHTSWNGDWRFIGDQGTLLYERDGVPHGERLDGDSGFHRALCEARLAETRDLPTGQHGGLCEMLRYLRTGEPSQCECHDNLKSLAMVFGVIESAARRERVEL